MKDRPLPISLIALAPLWLVAATVILIYTESILIPLTFAIFIYATIIPAVNFAQTKTGLHYYVSLLIVLVVLSLLGTVLFRFLTSSIATFANEIQNYSDRIESFLNLADQYSQKFGFSLDLTEVKGVISGAKVFSFVSTIVAGTLSSFSLSLLFATYFLCGTNLSKVKSTLIRTIINKISYYITMKLFISIGVGIVVWVVLTIAGIDLAFLISVLTIGLNFIPNIGSIIATLLPIPVIILQYGFGIELYGVIITLFTTQFLIGNVLEPKIMGSGMDLHPVTILIFLVFWGLVWGIPGMFLAVPITATIKIILDNTPATHQIGSLLAGRLSTDAAN